jgi:AcrR family transcriptional regulator
MDEAVVPRGTTPKGERTAILVLRAAIRVLARDGLAATTLRRVADEAGVDKRIIAYYYGSRDALLARVVDSVAVEIAQHIETAIANSDDPGEPHAALRAIWDGITTDRELARAYFYVTGDAVHSVELRRALEHLKTTYESLVDRQLRRSGCPDALRPTMDVLTFAVMRGLLLDWTEEGPRAEIDAAIEHFASLLCATAERT